MNIHVNLVILRLNKNLYQKDVAEALGIKVQTYQAYENHRATPPLKTIPYPKGDNKRYDSSYNTTIQTTLF